MYDWMGRDSEGDDWIPSHVRRGLDEDNILFLYVIVIFLAVFIRQYQFQLS